LPLFDNDILFSQGDQAEDIYFVFRGSILLYVDLSEIIDMQNLVKDDQSFNMPIAVYTKGSYFGDSDVVMNNYSYRGVTGIS